MRCGHTRKIRLQCKAEEVNGAALDADGRTAGSVAAAAPRAQLAAPASPPGLLAEQGRGGRARSAVCMNLSDLKSCNKAQAEA